MTRLLAIGDVHGCLNSLITLADFVSFAPFDTIVTLGDYVDRGPDSCAVLDWLIQFNQTHNLVCLRGNHEVMMLESREREDCFGDWLIAGGAQTLQSYSPFEGDDGKMIDVPDSHWNFLNKKLVDSYETRNHFFVHANALPEVPIDQQSPFVLYWQDFGSPELHQSGKIMICGHSTQKSGLPLSNGNAICLDTGAYCGGWLTCLDVEKDWVWQANELGETRSFHLRELASHQ